MDGIEILGRVRAHPLRNHTPVSMITAFADREHRLRALRAGADEFVEKPIDDAVLTARLGTLLRLKRSRDELASRNEKLEQLRGDQRALLEFILRDVDRIQYAASVGPGAGSELTLRRPLGAPPRRGASANESSDAAFRGRQILVVDDNREGAESLGMLLEILGAVVRVAFDGPSALELIEEGYVPAVVFLDIGMPRMDGYEVARRMRAALAGHPVVIAAVTGFSQDEDRRRAREAGFDHHLVKPADLDMLRDVLASVHDPEHGR